MRPARTLTTCYLPYYLRLTSQAGRMPLAYLHLVQLLVDSLTALTAPALYPKVRARVRANPNPSPNPSLALTLTLTLTKIGILSVGLTAVLTVFYRGLPAEFKRRP